ncbi:hypothetical protein [Bradyrhizobium diazoefficiens]
MKKLSIAGLALACLTESALACAPAPSCYMTESKDYLKTVCRQDARQPLDPKKFDEPDSVPSYIKACKKLGITVTVR